MESINMMKGYGKVNPEDHQPPPRPSHRRSTLLAVSLSGVLILTLTLLILLGAVQRDTAAESAMAASLAANSTKSILAVCGVTRHPDSCFTALSSLNSSVRPDPESIFNLSLASSLAELSNASFFVKQLKDTTNDVQSSGALGDCEVQLEDALSQLKESISKLVGVGSGKPILTELMINDIQTWVSAAMTDQETCLDGLEEMGSAFLDEVLAKLHKSKEMMSNSLAIVAHMKDLCEKFELE